MSTSYLILIIEPHAPTLARLQAELRSQGYQVLAAQRALEGLDIARKNQPDMILTYIALDDMSGRELATTLRSDPRFASTPIVAITDQEEEGDERDVSFAAGINGIIQKPIQYEALAIQMEFYLSGGSETAPDQDRLEAARTRYLQQVVSQLEGHIRELEAKNATLQDVDQMKDSFIQLTAHELRTPLTLITGYNRLLEDHPPLRELMKQDGEIRALISGLNEGIGRMQRIIEEILTMSRIMTNDIEINLRPTKLGKELLNVMREYEQALFERKLRVHVDYSQLPNAMRADGDLIRLVFSHLISNAIKYTPDGGDIYINAAYNAQLVRFSIRDTGIGIAAEKREGIFNRLHISKNIIQHGTSKTKFGGGGLGLGLAICKGIIEAHGGKIEVQSPGYDPETLPGSEFIVLLPLTTQKRTTTIRRLPNNHSS